MWCHSAMVARHNWLDAEMINDPELGLKGGSGKGKKKLVGFEGP